MSDSSNLPPVTAYADKKGKLHLTQLDVYKANNEYERDEYIDMIDTFMRANYTSSSYHIICHIPYKSLSTTTLRMMCIDLKVLSQ
jgi:hypothetical protein